MAKTKKAVRLSQNLAALRTHCQEKNELVEQCCTDYLFPSQSEHSALIQIFPRRNTIYHVQVAVALVDGKGALLNHMNQKWGSFLIRRFEGWQFRSTRGEALGSHLMADCRRNPANQSVHFASSLSHKPG